MDRRAALSSNRLYKPPVAEAPQHKSGARKRWVKMTPRDHVLKQIEAQETLVEGLRQQLEKKKRLYRVCEKRKSNSLHSRKAKSDATHSHQSGPKSRPIQSERVDVFSGSSNHRATKREINNLACLVQARYPYPSASNEFLGCPMTKLPSINKPYISSKTLKNIYEKHAVLLW
jgi:hypothetical protein